MEKVRHGAVARLLDDNNHCIVDLPMLHLHSLSSSSCVPFYGPRQPKAYSFHLSTPQDRINTREGKSCRLCVDNNTNDEVPYQTSACPPRDVIYSSFCFSDLHAHHPHPLRPGTSSSRVQQSMQEVFLLLPPSVHNPCVHDYSDLRCRRRPLLLHNHLYASLHLAVLFHQPVRHYGWVRDGVTDCS